jgi:hypothetical protein
MAIETTKTGYQAAVARAVRIVERDGGHFDLHVKGLGVLATYARRSDASRARNTIIRSAQSRGR